LHLKTSIPLLNNLQKMSKDSDNTISQLYLNDIVKILVTRAEYILFPTKYKLFSSAQRTFIKVDHILNFKTSLNKFRRIYISFIFYINQ
jgi:hypothetical protein